MKRWMIASLMVLFATTSFAQAGGTAESKGTIFQKGTLKELLEMAKKENKYLFIDMYTTWCGPCKTMTAKVFPDEKVGTYFNKNFITAKFDAEKGEGLDLAKTYKVRAYPTFLLLDSTGKEVGRMVGGDEPDAFIKKVQGLVDNIDKK